MTCINFDFSLKLSMNYIHFTALSSYSPCFRLNLHKPRLFRSNPYARKPPVETGGFFKEENRSA